MLDSPDITSRVEEILEAHRGVEGAFLPILHAIQASFGYIPEAALLQAAKALTIPKAEAFGVMTFYHDFRDAPPGRHVVKLCRSESCQARGAEKLHEHARSSLGVDWKGTTKDGRVTLEPVYCLGLCACGPSMTVDGEVVGLVDEVKFDEIVKGLD